MRRAVLTTLSAVFVLAPTIALAHPGHGDPSGRMQGLAHPITGIDHVLAMVGVGVLAAQLGGRALWLVPLSFMSVMAGAGALGMAGIQLPLAEVGIALSVIVLGVRFSQIEGYKMLEFDARVGRCDDRTPSSDSARSSQLPCFGVYGRSNSAAAK